MVKYSRQSAGVEAKDGKEDRETTCDMSVNSMILNRQKIYIYNLSPGHPSLQKEQEVSGLAFFSQDEQ